MHSMTIPILYPHLCVELQYGIWYMHGILPTTRERESRVLPFLRAVLKGSLVVKYLTYFYLTYPVWICCTCHTHTHTHSRIHSMTIEYTVPAIPILYILHTHTCVQNIMHSLSLLYISYIYYTYFIPIPVYRKL